MSGAEETSPSPAEWAGISEAVPGATLPRRRLFRKYALIFIALVGAALLINSGFDFWFSYQENKAALVRVQQEKAAAAAQRIAEFVEEIKSQIGWTTHARWAAGPLDQRRQDYVRLLRQVPAITELRQLDGDGKERLLSSRLAMDVSDSGADFSQSPAFIEAKAHKVWFSPVYFRKESEPYMSLAMALDGKNAGVTIADINLKLLFDVITALKIGQGGYAYVVDGRGRLIAHPDISLVLRDTDLSKLPQVAAALNPQPGEPAVMTADNLAGHSVLTAHAEIPQLGWRVFVEVPLAEAFAPLYGAALRTVVLLALGLIAATLVALVIARRMTGPIHAIAAGAERLGAGDLGRRIDIRTGDELEGLAQQFNRMAADLQKSYAELEQRVRDRTAELSEALERQTATAEVLGIISSSPGHLEPVFEAVLANAVRICGGRFGLLALREGDRFRGAAAYGVGADVFPLSRLQHPPPGTGLAVLQATKQTAQVADCAIDPAYEPVRAASPAFAEMRTALHVAMLKEGELIGAIIIYRGEVLPFDDKEIELVENFAKQAVIAIENVRLITEIREALDQQTATAEVLGVINGSPGNLAPVFDAMLEKAMRLCDASFGQLATYDGERFGTAATWGVPAAFAEYRRGNPPVYGPGTSPTRILQGERVLHTDDLKAEAAYHAGEPNRRALVDLGGARSAVIVALRKDDAVLGFIQMYRQEVRPFSEKQIALLQNFAAQAVIAMENARLITETREALEQQTATAEVLGVINSSPGNLAPVFDRMTDEALRLCDARFGGVLTWDGERFFSVSTRGFPQALVQVYREPFKPGSRSYVARLVSGEDVVHVADMAAQYPSAPGAALSPGQEPGRALVELGNARTGLFVALRKENALLGAIRIYRTEVRPFTEKQIALLQNFAAQAVIAMENARLITETREALEQQTATAEVLGVINSSPGDLTPVFDTMLEKAMRLCEASFGSFGSFDGEFLHAVAHRNVPAEVAEAMREPIAPTAGGHLILIAAGEGVVHIPDFADTEAYRLGKGWAVALVDKGGARTAVWVALRKDNALLGALVIYRKEVRPFSDKQISLLQNFAAQAVIAMENARLITETREALEQQTATAEVLGVINSSPGDLAPVFEALLDKALTLCGGAFGFIRTYDGEAFHLGAMRGVPPDIADLMKQPRRPPFAGSGLERIVGGETIVEVQDITELPAYRAGAPTVRAMADIAGARTFLWVALRKEGALLGFIAVYRHEIRPFSDKQIALLQNFAAQAVIAMENARLITETREALEQQTATAEVLGVINSSPGNLVPVFESILEKAHSLCDVARGTLELYDGENFRAVAMRGIPAALGDMLRRGTIASENPMGRPLLAGARYHHVADMAMLDDPVSRAATRNDGGHTVLSIPLRIGDALLGMIVASRTEVRLFTDNQIALLENFATQAVIAMENARLITETRERTRDLQESLEYQTATSDVLKVISQSTFDLEPVLQTVLDTAMRLCGNSQGEIFRLEDGVYRMAVGYGMEPAYREIEAQLAIPPGPDTLVGRTALAGRPVQIVDALDDPDYLPREDARVGNLRSMLGVPLMREGEPIGVICTARTMVKPFSDKEIELVRTFADQAVIAIENARLLNELRGRTRDLQESLEYQTATSDVLKVISRSTFDLDPVLENVIETAIRLCRAHMGSVFRLEDGLYRWAVGYGLDPAYRDIEIANPIAPGTGTLVGRVAVERQAVQIPDAWTDPDYAVKDEAQITNARTMLGVPLLRAGMPIGVIAMARDRVEAFSDKEIALVTTFADQAVIAIENARLLNELRERTDELAHSVEELKALAEVGQEVSSTLDLGEVLSTVLNRSVGLTQADAGVIFRYSQGRRAFRLVEAVGWDIGLAKQVRQMHIDQNMTLMGDAVARRAPTQIADLRERPGNVLRDATLAAGYRSVLIVPLVGADRTFGVLLLQRRRPGEFPEATVRLMQTLAAQSVLAIQNARLFREIADKSEQLALASQHKSQFLANMSHELRTPLNAILGYAELLVDGIYGEVPEKAMAVLERVQNNGKHLLALINDVLDLSKIEAGQLTLTFEDYALPDVVLSVVTATEALASTKGLKMTATVAPGLPTGHGDARRLSQVLLNLVGNAVKFTDAGEVAIGAMAEHGQFVLTVRDTGPGIAPEDHGKIFEEFQQVDSSNTRKKGGTGLGLAISKRMVEMQGGSIGVESKLGHGATFRVTLPIRVEHAADELTGELMGAA